jgi:hypothetical protein
MYPVTLVIMGWPWDPCLIAAPSVPWLAFQVGIRIRRPSHNVAEILSPDSLYPTPPTAALVTAWFYISARNGVWVEPRSRTEGRIAVILVIRSPISFVMSAYVMIGYLDERAVIAPVTVMTHWAVSRSKVVWPR